ncbi:MAG: pyridoxamine 5'-phosphate oxidase family protein, partial [Desulfobacterales bacterium]|nr:pyridoxamine 5'-phosphate oxidase family protein [Desulfobacterales bacterium]
MQSGRTFDDHAIVATAPAEKIGLVATVNPQGLPHITLLTSLRAAGPRQLTIGEFCKGSSKAHMQQNPRVGFLIMTRDRHLWRGKAHWTHLRQEGPEYEQYNNLPMFRYNAYFGINTVHYLDLKALTVPAKLPMGAILRGALRTRLAKGALAPTQGEKILKPFAQRLFNRMDALKFIAHIDADGYPRIIPVIQCQAADCSRLVFARQPYGVELARIPQSSRVALFGLTM